MSKSRRTIQKELILKEIENMKVFFSAAELYSRINSKHKIGIATIYRILNQLTKDYIIYSFVCDKRNIYSKHGRNHCHFVCEDTGEIIHFNIDSLDFLKDKLPGKIISFQIEIKGIKNKK
ncbi:MAG: transcriptional repressor [archaeon]|jgi:Fe2+ or Zn2+ uptake regulation protein